MSHDSMSADAKRILDEAFRLTASDRAAWIDGLPTDPKIDARWLKEIKRRWAAFEAGESKPISAEVVFKELEEEFGGPRPLDS